MPPTAKITSKGQITIPQEVRRALGVKEGDRLSFEEREGEMRIIPIRTESVFARYQGIGPGKPMSKKALVKKWREMRGE